MLEPSALSLVPPVVVVVLAIVLRRPILSLLIGALVGLAMLNPVEMLSNFAAASLKVMVDETIGWLILVCGGFGALIALLVRTGGAAAFGSFALRFCKGPRSSLLMTFLLGIVIFIDDYLNALTVGETMKRITDKFKISREMLAYVVDSTAAPICVLVPLSTWAVFFGGLLVDNNIAVEGQGIAVYIQAIPYMLYAWFAVLLVPLVVLGVIPLFGPMKKAQLQAMQEQPQVDPAQYNEVQTADEYAVKAVEESFESADSHGKLYNFLLPILLLVAFTVYFDIDVYKGLLATFAVTLPFYMLQKLMPFAEMIEKMLDGFKSMLPAIGTVIAAFIFKDVCDQLLLPQFVIDSLSPFMTAGYLPAVVFLAMAILAFATGSSWGIFAVTIPIVMPLAVAVDANIPLVIGALLSASSFGSQACFYSDSTVLAAQGSGCNLMSHAITQLPYTLIAAACAFVGFLVIA
ncbi:MAG: tetracycline resistance efflux pump [Pseudoalteromonas rhizosphaerae]|jgi:tetracycline resistance efflux pump|uniref:Sodium:proton antiporter n=2 Tax=Pseudoalteromonas TaxID=53246 RepID=A0ABY3FHU2_9GAMM|nr:MULTISPECIES: Na+/H+ antiporter NhaC family protein [Pseudoalteromonas]MBB1291370.1 sodium:proton antiporter [Pseudoalteromonas sp. SR41-4]MBB1300053.1 sodium:proton antiporter [Pseudoalteromonas sp. SR44-8]MBB1308139.1 sodium:proton antiporter [Pseudoalteromonas sp. SR41-8]MBB1396207.1 sodium:proton antiporter [Pseudoalteromonas sp. SG44-8]MBB1407958.1 sodium:proton antiporter [Pseudoalteromonas sp. SG44-17]|tara:strand:- start:6555 stop:7937 length:1383 start_codon:yes stop_codon:yes gene_type:complete